MSAYLDLDDVAATSPAAARELAELRQALDALLEIAEQVVDPETCSAGIRRAMDDARRTLGRA